ncbi:hypothetical protein [Streptomyces sp. NBC_01465]|uniref:hypothetical protein n=1 Tax=Streptomyces sp. NBC_01465 TaxID=2903878 RepID=UPI002E2EF71F|nr:hypothetical protein [Streptomyces sp. NBC_01465]
MVPDVQEPEKKPRRRGRTTLIVVAAAVLGIVAGTAVGYKIQADRPPTPLPVLAQEGLTYPAKAAAKGQEPAALSAKEDTLVRTDGDLRKLLIPKPRGARTASFPVFKGGTMPRDNWLTPADYAYEFTDEAQSFTYDAEKDIRRIAAADFQQGEFKMTSVRLVQFRDGVSEGASDSAVEQQSYMSDSQDGAGYDGDAVKGSGNARYYIVPVENKPGYLPNYGARAIGYRGDVMFDISIFDTHKISKSDIRALAEQQLGRL